MSESIVIDWGCYSLKMETIMDGAGVERETEKKESNDDDNNNNNSSDGSDNDDRLSEQRKR